MASAAYFAPAFQPASATDNLPRCSYETNRKRKTVAAVSENKYDDDQTEVPVSDCELEHLSSVASGREAHSQDTAFQYEISGHPIGKTLTGSNFPHAFRQRPRDSLQPEVKSKISDELAGLRPPLCVAAGLGSNVGNAKSGAVGLRQQHLIALTAVLHKCVLQGDFIRAGRAWGMLLRAEHNGHSFDLRINDRWGLGAEIILRREAQLVHNKGESGKTFNPHGADDQHRVPSDLFNPQAFDQVKDYYERLVLQYPHRKAFANTTGSRDFYVAMFSSWIYSVEKQRLFALAEIGKGAADGQRTGAGVVNQDVNELAPDTEQRHHRRREAVCEDTLQRAKGIAVRLEELLMSPPYSDNTMYSQLQGMVNMWIKDLSNVPDGSGRVEGRNSMSESSSISSGLDREEAAS